METQNDAWEVVTQEHVDDVVDTQERVAKTEHPTGSDPGADTQEPVDDIVITQELAVEAKATQG